MRGKVQKPMALILLSLINLPLCGSDRVGNKPQTRLIKRHWAAPQLMRLVAGFPPRRPGFKPGSSLVEFVVDKVALGQVFFEYFGFHCQSSFHQFLHNHHHL
jgi:hypothetical protein